MRRVFLTLAVCLILAGMSGAMPPPDPDPEPVEFPYNVIFIIVDDIGVDQVGVYAQDYFRPGSDSLPCTPNIDALAANGVRFTNAWSNPVCSPTRTMAMTGRPASETGMGMVTSPTRPTNEGVWPDFETIADLAPTSAHAIGKWHMADETQGPTHPLDLGFDTFLGPMYNLSGPPQDGSPGGTGYTNWRKWDAQSCTPIPGTLYVTEETTDDAINVVSNFGNGGSFLWLAYNASHTPFHCPDPVHCGSNPACPTVDWCATCNSNSPLDKTRAMTQALDHYIGELMSYVDFSNTAVIFVGDNGTPGPATVAPFDPSHAKGKLYQGGINVPFIIRPPDGTAAQTGTKCNTLVSLTDVHATAADYLGGTPAPDVDSYSLRPLIENGDCTDFDREFVYSEFFAPTFRPENGLPPAGFMATGHTRAIRDATHKLIERNLASGPLYELYRLYDPNSTEAYPHDPADLDYPGSDPLHSAFEITPVPQPYTGDDLTAFNDLQTGLSNYTRLPVGAQKSIPAEEVRTVLFTSFAPPIGGGQSGSSALTIGYFCDESTIKVGRKEYPNGSETYRTFLEFDVCDVGCAVDDRDSLVSVSLEVPVLAGADFTVSAIEVYDINAAEDMDDVSDYGQSEPECQTLYEATGTTLYGSRDDWIEWDGTEGFCSPVTKIIHLDGILDEIWDEATEQGDKRLSMALTLTFGAQPDLVDLYDIVGSIYSDQYQLRVNYNPAGTAPCGCQPGGMGGGMSSPAADSGGRLQQSYPNPFNPKTTIAYSVRERAHVTLNVYDVAGRLVRTLVSGVQDPRDRYEVTWDGRDDGGSSVASGVYFYQLTVGTHTETKKMMLLK